MPACDKPPAEVAVDAPLVRGLLSDQHPDLARLPLVRVGSGWDNELFRLGEAWVVRLPRRALAADLVAGEQRWLPELAGRLPLPVPVPARRGGPGRGYPWAWSICPWLEGENAAEASLDPARAASDAGAFLRALHTPAPDDAPRNAFRGVPLGQRDAAFRERVAALDSALEARVVLEIWQDALAAPPHGGPPVWLHGDLHPANLLVRGGRLCAVLDFGDLTGGDPATDLAVAWTLLPAGVRPRFREAAGAPDEATWRRARGWALSHAVACLAHSADDARMRRIGEVTLARVLQDRPV